MTRRVLVQHLLVFDLVLHVFVVRNTSLDTFFLFFLSLPMLVRGHVLMLYVSNRFVRDNFCVTPIGFKSQPLKLRSMMYIFAAYVDKRGSLFFIVLSI